jgi:hypothetical protein
LFKPIRVAAAAARAGVRAALAEPPGSLPIDEIFA